MHHLSIPTVSYLASDDWDELYAIYLRSILNHGKDFVGRNGLSKYLFGASITVDLTVSFPLTALRKMPFKNIVRETLFDLGFSQNVEALGKAKHFWDFLADEDGNLGASAYNRQWQMWPAHEAHHQVANETLAKSPVNQISRVIALLKESDHPTRHGTVITLNPAAINTACPPCHLAMQFMPDGEYLDVMVPARSNDMSIGFPIDICRYSLILMIISNRTGLKPRYVYMPSANSHIYENNFELTRQMTAGFLSVNPCQVTVANKPIKNLQLDDFELTGYNSLPPIKFNLN